MSADNPDESFQSLREALQSMWKVPSVAQFVSLFCFALKLPELEIEELEDGLLGENEVGCKLFEALIVAILKGIMPSRGVNESNWEENLEKLINRLWLLEEGVASPLLDKKFRDVHIAAKVDILHFVCYYRLGKFDVQEAMKTMDAEALRVQPLGCDELGNEYWYFYGTRLYKQEPPKEIKTRNWQDEWNQQKERSLKRGRGRPKKEKFRKSDGESDESFEEVDAGKSRYMNIDEKSRWSVVCNTIEDWVDFAERFKSSKSKCEKALFLTVKDNFLPILNDIYQEKERKLQQKLKELLPRAKIVTRRVTRKETFYKSLHNGESNGYDEPQSENWYEMLQQKVSKEHLAKERAARLEERNRRLSEVSPSPKRKRSRSRKYEEDNSEDDFDGDWEDAHKRPKQRRAGSNAGKIDDSDVENPKSSSEGTDLKSRVLSVLKEVKFHKDAGPFLLPVQESYAPGYYEIISNPMDISTIFCKLYESKYSNVNEIDDDFKLMVSNCKLYNGETSDLTIMVIKLWRTFRNGIAKISSSMNVPNHQKPVHSTITVEAIEAQVQNAVPTKDGINCSKVPEDSSKIITESNVQYNYKSSVTAVKPKKKNIKKSNMEALEALSRESALAVEQLNKKDRENINNLVPKNSYGGLFSDLKIVPIHSHPASLIEKFSSDSSSQDVNNEEDAGDITFLCERSRSPQSQPTAEANYFSDHSDDSSGLTDLINKDNPKGFNILSDGEGNSTNILRESSPCSPMKISQPVSEKESTNGSEGLGHGIANILDECNRENMTSLMNGYSHYSGDEHASSDKDSHSSNSNPQSPGSDRVKNDVNDQNIPILQDALDIHSELRGYSSASETSTVDATVLGISTNHIQGTTQKSSSPPEANISDASSNPFSYQNAGIYRNEVSRVRPEYPPMLPALSDNCIPSSGSHIQSTEASTFAQYPSYKSIAHTTNAPVSSTVMSYTSSLPSSNVPQIPLQIPASFSKMFQPQVMGVVRPDAGRFPNLKVKIPQSSGSLYVVPGKTDPSSMTFHLYAQPTDFTSKQPIEQHCIIQADGTVQPMDKEDGRRVLENQISTASKEPAKETSVIRSPMRKSPLQSDSTSPPSQPTSSPRGENYSPLRVTQNNLNPSHTHLVPSAPPNITTSSFNPVYSDTSSVIRPNNSLLKAATFDASPLQEFPPRVINSNPQNSSFQTLPPRTVPGPNLSYRNPLSIEIPPTKDNVHANQAMQRFMLPNGATQFPPASIMQNSNGQLVYVLPQGPPCLQTDRSASSKPMMEMATTPNGFPGSGSGMQSYAVPNSQLTPSQIYTQVTSNQIPQFVNIPQYMVADQSMMQNTMRYPVMNVQPMHFANRGPVPINMGSR